MSKGAPGRIQTATRPQMRQAATAFVKRWQGEKRERAEKDTFWNEFLSIFGLDRRRVGVFEYVAERYSTGRSGFMDLLIPGLMGVEHKSDVGKPGESEADRDARLGTAMDQLVDYLIGLRPRDVPEVLVVCDFHWFRVRDIESGSDVTFPLSELAKHVDDFAFLAGYARQASMEPEEAANLRATAHLGRLHDALVERKYPSHDLRVLLTRLLYILFADDTAIWTRNLFYDWLLVHTREDGGDLGSRLIELFQVLDTDYADRQAGLPVDLEEFAYINGGLFEENIRTPHCDAEMREHLLDACAFEWSAISPAIFGSLFQGVMDTKQRRELGAHYTSERDILRTIKPLFLDELDERVATAKALGDRQARLRALRSLRDSLGQLRFLDPACGCGNFLMLSYKELRRVELECLVAIREAEAAGSKQQRPGGLGQAALDVSIESVVNVGQFYGIELEEFPARIAETAMHLVDHQANLALSEALGDYYVRLPIRDTAHVTVGNALRLDWADVLPPDSCSYILGNPPFAGQYSKTPEQTDDLKSVWGEGYYGYLDYVTGWYVKAAAYIGTRPTRVAFVSTNSICQGEPVAPLWEPLFQSNFRIDFAHRTFLWRSEAASPAGVHVVIVGWSQRRNARNPILYEYGFGGKGEPVGVHEVENINAYLAPSANVFVKARTTPLSRALPSVDYGSKVGDGGFLLIKPEERGYFLSDSVALKYVRPFIGARELIHSEEKWCLWLQDLDPEDLKASPLLSRRVESVKAYRLEPGRDKEIRDAASRPATFLRNKQPDSPYLAIPRHVGESRPYFPVRRFSSETVTGDHNFRAADADGFTFALLSSAAFMLWMRTFAGRLRADPRFSKTVVWNNFPVPPLSDARREAVIEAGRGVEAMRAKYPDRSLSGLYTPMAVPVDLLTAHGRLDREVDKLYSPKKRIDDDVDRLAAVMRAYVEALSEGQFDIPRQSGSAKRRRR